MGSTEEGGPVAKDLAVEGCLLGGGDRDRKGRGM